MPDVLSLQVVRDLCSTLQNSGHSCVGFHLDGNGYLRGTYHGTHFAPSTSGGTKLDELLGSNHGVLAPQERYELAITLTCSLLQLSATPWLDQAWSKTDIIFFKSKGDSINLDHPYLTREHTHPCPPHVTPVLERCDDCVKIGALGIMLLEICSGQPIETLIRPDDLGPNDQVTVISQLQAARRWLKNKGVGYGFAFPQAIKFCLQCFVDPSSCLTDEPLARAIRERVLEPLDAERTMLLYGPG